MSAAATMRERDNAVRTVMGTPIGRRFVMDVLESCHWQRNPFAESSNALSYNVGVQSVGITLFSLLERTQPLQTRDMLTEWRERMDAIEAEMEIPE